MSDAKGRMAVIYLRVSTEEQAAEGVSLDAQRAKAIAYCELSGLAVIEACADEGVSGKRSDNRPGFQRAMELACRFKAVLVVYSLSRLARNTKECIAASEWLAAADADLVSLTEKIDTTSAMGRFTFTLMAALAQLEREQISERVRFALAHKRLIGERTGKVPYGYVLGEDGVRLVAEPSEQSAIMSIVDLRRRSFSLGDIARKLNALGVRTKNGGKWQRSSVQRILDRAKESA